MNITEYFLNSTLHGLHFIADKRLHWTERLFWTVCVVASWVGSALLIINALDGYRNQSVTFTVDTSYLDWKTNFPSIVVCEKNNTKAMKLIDQWFPNETKKITIAKEIIFYRRYISFKVDCNDSKKKKDCLLGNFSYYMLEARSTCAEIFTSCYYNGKPFECCREFQEIECVYGTCFAFNSLVPLKNRKTMDVPFKINRKADYNYGNLSVEFSNENLYLIGLGADSVPTFINVKSAIAGATKQTDIKKHTQYNAYLSIKETVNDEAVKSLDIDKRGCKYYEENDLKFSTLYSMSACENECEANCEMEFCKCYIHTLPQVATKYKKEECDVDGIVCYTINMEKIVNMTKSCICHSSCFDSEVRFIGKTESHFKTEDRRDERSVARFNFIVQPPTIRYSRTVVKSSLDMIVSIGGLMGLFVGASVLTIFEIVYYLVVRPLGNEIIKKKSGAKNGDQDFPLPFIN